MNAFLGVGPIKNTSQSNSKFGLAKKSPLNPQFQCPQLASNFSPEFD